MPITNRNLPAGTRLVAKYRGETWQAEVQDTEPTTYALLGEHRLTDQPAAFKSLSAAGSAIMGGIACNGWRFWSVEGDEPARAEKPAKTKAAPKAKAAKPKTERKPRTRAEKFLRPYKDQEGLGEGEVRWWCSACLDSFVVFGNEEPTQCPNGHRADDPELAAAPAAQEIATV